MNNQTRTDNLGNIHYVSDDAIEAGDLIIEHGKPVVKCIETDIDTLVWESLDGKSSASDDTFVFKKVVPKPYTSEEVDKKISNVKFDYFFYGLLSGLAFSALIMCLVNWFK